METMMIKMSSFGFSRKFPDLCLDPTTPSYTHHLSDNFIAISRSSCLYGLLIWTNLTWLFLPLSGCNSSPPHSIFVQQLHHQRFRRKEAIPLRAPDYVTCRLQNSTVACHQDSTVPGSWPRESPCYKVSVLVLPHSQRYRKPWDFFSDSSLSAAKKCPQQTYRLLNKWYSGRQGGGWPGRTSCCFQFRGHALFTCHYSPPFDFML